MSAPERALLLIRFSIPPGRRARFLEEWRTDLREAAALGVSPWSIVAAACRVAFFLTSVHARAAVHRQRSRRRLVALGTAGGLVLVVTDCPTTVLVPFVLLVVVGWSWWWIGRWVNGEG